MGGRLGGIFSWSRPVVSGSSNRRTSPPQGHSKAKAAVQVQAPSTPSLLSAWRRVRLKTPIPVELVSPCRRPTYHCDEEVMKMYMCI